MIKRILLGTLVVILTLAVLGGVGAVAYGIGMRQGLGQTRLAISANANGSQVLPPQRGQQNLPGNQFKRMPSQGANPRIMPFMQAQPFQASPRNIMSFRSFNPIGAFFAFAIPLLLLVLLVALIIRVVNRRPLWGHSGDKVMMGAPPSFEEWHKHAHEAPVQQPPDEAKEA